MSVSSSAHFRTVLFLVAFLPVCGLAMPGEEKTPSQTMRELHVENHFLGYVQGALIIEDKEIAPQKKSWDGNPLPSINTTDLIIISPPAGAFLLSPPIILPGAAGLFPSRQQSKRN